MNLVAGPASDGDLDAAPDERRFGGLIGGIGFQVETGAQHPDIHIPGMDKKRMSGVRRHVKKGLPHQVHLTVIASGKALSIFNMAACIEPDLGAIGQREVGPRAGVGGDLAGC